MGYSGGILMNYTITDLSDNRTTDSEVKKQCLHDRSDNIEYNFLWNNYFFEKT